MTRVRAEMPMIARRATTVVVHPTTPRSATPLAPERRRSAHPGLLALAALLVAACGGSEFAYVADDARGHSLSVMREQAYLGGPWRATLVVGATSRCQKRHPLPGLEGGEVLVKVFRPQPGNYILQVGRQWYVTEFEGCNLQAYREPPPFPGEAAGRFEKRAGKFEFVAEKPPKK
jgi:hypothetical protein